MFKKALSLSAILTTVCFLAPFPVYAYLDPGSGSYLIQIIVASLAGFGYLVRANWKQIKTRFFKKAKNEAEREKNKSAS